MAVLRQKKALQDSISNAPLSFDGHQTDSNVPLPQRQTQHQESVRRGQENEEPRRHKNLHDNGTEVRRRGIRTSNANSLLFLLFLVLSLASEVVFCAPSAVLSQSPKQQGSGEVVAPRKDSSYLEGYEPSCDELRAMWRFSKRQSRASEMTNEIPTYRGDPFALNVWKPNKPRMSKQSPNPFLSRVPSQYFSGRKYPYGTARFAASPSNSDYGKLVRSKPDDAGQNPYQGSGHRMPQLRFGSNLAAPRTGGSTALNATPHQGMFMKLKEVLWNERVQDLMSQRKQAELMARAAVLKELANGGLGSQLNNQEQYYQDAQMDDSDYDESRLTDNYGAGGSGGAGEGRVGPKLSHFRERETFLLQKQQQMQRQQQQQQMQSSGSGGNSKIDFPSKYSRLY